MESSTEQNAGEGDAIRFGYLLLYVGGNRMPHLNGFNYWARIFRYVSLFCVVAQGHLKDSLQTGRKGWVLQVEGGGAAVCFVVGNCLILAGFLLFPLAEENVQGGGKPVSLIWRVEKAQINK